MWCAVALTECSLVLLEWDWDSAVGDCSLPETSVCLCRSQKGKLNGPQRNIDNIDGLHSGTCDLGIVRLRVLSYWVHAPSANGKSHFEGL